MESSADTPRPRLSLKKRLIMTAIMIGMTLIVAEVLLRVLAREVVLRHRMSEGGLYTPFKPNGVGFHVSPEFNVCYTINNHGFRDRPRKINKKASATRIVLLGDSFSVGWGVAQDKSFAALAEANLRKQDKDLELWNTARSGSNPLFYIEQARKFRDQLKPDAFLVQIFDNDIVEIAQYRRRCYWGSDGQFIAFQPRFGPQSYSLFNIRYQWNHLALRRAVRKLKDLMKGESFKHFLAPGVSVTFPEDALKKSDLMALVSGKDDQFNARTGWYFPEFRESWLPKLNYEKQIITQLIHECKKQHVKIGFIYIPHVMNFAHSKSAAELRKYNPHRAQLIEICESEHIPLMDVTQILEEQTEPKDFYFAGDLHFNERGHKLLATKLVERGFIKTVLRSKQ